MTRVSHRRRLDDRGVVAAELVVALPAVVLVLVLGVGALAAASRQVRLEDAAADAARLVARGDGDAAARGAVSRAVPGATVGISSRDDLACVTAAASARVVVPIALRATSCALAGGR